MRTINSAASNVLLQADTANLPQCSLPLLRLDLFCLELLLGLCTLLIELPALSLCLSCLYTSVDHDHGCHNGAHCSANHTGPGQASIHAKQFRHQGLAQCLAHLFLHLCVLALQSLQVYGSVQSCMFLCYMVVGRTCNRKLVCSGLPKTVCLSQWRISLDAMATTVTECVVTGKLAVFLSAQVSHLQNLRLWGHNMPACCLKMLTG